MSKINEKKEEDWFSGSLQAMLKPQSTDSPVDRKWESVVVPDCVSRNVYKGM